MRTDLEQGRPTTALARRHTRLLDQVFGGKRPTRREGGVRRRRLTHARALGTVAARRERVVGSTGAIASARRAESKSLTSAPTEKVSSASALLFPAPSIPGWYAEEGASISINPVERTGGESGALHVGCTVKHWWWFRPNAAQLGLLEGNLPDIFNAIESSTVAMLKVRRVD